MLPELTYKEVLRNTKFPFFVLISDDIQLRDGLLLIDELVVDDLNQVGNTLGRRRLQTPHKKLPLKKCIFDFQSLIDAKAKYFIDAKGLCFSYVKTKLVYVSSYKIYRKEAHDTYSTIFCKGVNNIYVLPRFPHSSEWAQIIELDGLPWKLYSVSTDFIAKYKRKI